MESRSWIITVLLFCSVFSGAEEAVPTHRKIEEYRSEFVSSVFLRTLFDSKTLITEDIPETDFGKMFVLDGVVKSDKEVMAFIRDQKEKIVLVATSTKGPNTKIWIAKSSLSDDPRETSVTVTNGTDQKTLKYGNDRFLKRVRFSSNEKPGNNRTAAAKGGVVGNPQGAVRRNEPAPQKPVETEQPLYPDEILEKKTGRPRIILPTPKPIN